MSLELILQGTGITLLAAGVIALFRMYGALIQVKSWQEAHEKADDVRKDMINEQLEHISEKLDSERALATALQNLTDVLKAIHISSERRSASVGGR